MPTEPEKTDADLPNVNPAAIHGDTAPGVLPPPMVIYQMMLKSFVKAGSPTMTNWMQRGWRLLHAMAPASPAEEVIASQLILTEARLAYLQHFALVQTTHKNIRLFHELCNQTLNSLGRVVHSLTEHRRPRRRSYVTVRSANIARKQIVNHFPRRKNVRRLQSLSADVPAVRKETKAPPVPIEPAISVLIPSTDSETKALATQQRPENPDRQTDQQPKRP
jgi:hypothetical protein